MATLFVAFGNCGRLQYGGSGEPYEGVKTDPDLDPGEQFTDREGVIPEPVDVECKSTDPRYDFLSARISGSSHTQILVAIDQVIAGQIDELYYNSPALGLQIYFGNGGQFIESISVLNSPLRVRLEVRQVMPSAQESIIFSCGN